MKKILTLSLLLTASAVCLAGKMAHIDQYGNLFVFDSAQIKNPQDFPKLVAEASANLQDGIQAWNAKNYNKAIPLLTKAASLENPVAYYLLGTAYCNGLGVNKDIAKGINFLEKASTKESMYSLGIIYFRQAQRAGSPENLINNIETTISWLTKAADKGHCMSQVLLAEFYYGSWSSIFKNLDFSSVIDYGKSAFWYRKAAEQGNANAQIGLADMLYCGRGIKQDRKEAKRWAEEAQKRGNPKANKFLQQNFD